MVNMTDFYFFYTKALKIRCLVKLQKIPYETVRPLQAH